ncbi:hypothetical protein [Micromonospora sp. NPDC049679]|uniref:SCO6745 family protein n=1 Tax=Micromonospora sp. NPDC049679 TaxID=3155920 RepID=UPI0033D44707
MTPEQAANAAKPGLLELGGAFSECPQTLRRARRMGLSGWAFYVAGRGGALGDVPAETAAAALGFIAPEAVADGWDVVRQITTPGEVAATALQECCRWGAEQLDGFPRVTRLVELARRIVQAADPAGMPLFAAWRGMPTPDDAPGARAAVLLHHLREYRGGAHLLAVRASGLTPLEAIVAGPEGEAGAVAFGWQPPYPPIGPLVRRRLWAEAVTDRITGSAFAALEAPERAEFVGLLESASARVRAAAAPALRA